MGLSVIVLDDDVVVLTFTAITWTVAVIFTVSLYLDQVYKASYGLGDESSSVLFEVVDAIWQVDGLHHSFMEQKVYV